MTHSPDIKERLMTDCTEVVSVFITNFYSCLWLRSYAVQRCNNLADLTYEEKLTMWSPTCNFQCLCCCFDFVVVSHSEEKYENVNQQKVEGLSEMSDQV